MNIEAEWLLPYPEYALHVNVCTNLCDLPCCIKWMLAHFGVRTPTTGQNNKIIRQVSTISGWGVAGFVSCEGVRSGRVGGEGLGDGHLGGGNGGIWKTHSFVRLGGATAYRIC